jgi:tRNA (adenine37-N6)-methyltransferase
VNEPSDTDTAPTASLALEPIGFVRTALATKVEAARQPRAGGGAPGRIELLPGRNFEHALVDLAGWEYLWVLFWFDRNRGWRPKVLPPRSRSGRKGVFATRSPHRPNPLGLSAVRLERVDGLTLHVADVDMLDGTPVLDIKPYVAYTDAIPDARYGWLGDDASSAATPRDPIARFDVRWDALAAEQAEWIEARTQLALHKRVTATLELGIEPHPYRRIRPDGDVFVLGIKEWRVRFAADGNRVQVREVVSSFRDSQLYRRPAELRVHRDVILAHREFRERYSAAGSILSSAPSSSSVIT